MKKQKIVFFKINNVIVEQIEASDITLDALESLKTSIAVVNRVCYDDIDVEVGDVKAHELSHMIVREDGVLMTRPKFDSLFRTVSGVRPAFDISHEELFYEFLDLIQKKDIDNALIFN